MLDQMIYCCTKHQPQQREGVLFKAILYINNTKWIQTKMTVKYSLLSVITFLLYYCIGIQTEIENILYFLSKSVEARVGEGRNATKH